MECWGRLRGFAVSLHHGSALIDTDKGMAVAKFPTLLQERTFLARFCSCTMDDISPAVKDVLRRMFARKVRNRPTARQVMEHT